MRFSRLVWPLAILCSLLFAAHTADASDCSAQKSGKFKVKIDSSPQGAVIYINGKDCPSVGNTPWEGSLNAGDLTVILEAPGYDATTRPFRVARVRARQDLFVPLAKKPQLEIRADADPHLIGATVTIDGQPAGVIQGPLVINTTAARHLIEIKREGYETLSQWIDLTTTPQLTITPTLAAGKRSGSVIVEANVDQAEVYLDGTKLTDTTPMTIKDVSEGSHVVEVRKGDQNWKVSVDVKANQQSKVNAQLQGGVGVIRVLSDAQGARASLDGVDMGSVPVDIKDVKSGEHLVQVKAPNFATMERKVTVTAGSSKVEKFDLAPEQLGERGLLRVVSTIPDAVVYIDGAAVGKSPQEKKVPAGTHPVMVKLDGYKPFDKQVTVKAGETQTISAELKAVGQLRVITTPARATVSINGIVAGTTPFNQEIEVGETVVRVELATFQPFEQTINMEGGKTETISRELVVAGPTEQEVVMTVRNLSSFGARTLPRGRSTVDIGAGYPYFFEGRVNVGVGPLGPNNTFGFDAGIAARTMFAQTELGFGARLNFLDANPFSMGAFTNIWWGSKLLDDSGRNGLTWDTGLVASLSALAGVTISGRLYLDAFSDRHCPSKGTQDDGFDGTPIAVCREYKDGTINAMERSRIEGLTGWRSPEDVFNRDNGVRLFASLIGEFAIQQGMTFFAILEGDPFTQHYDERPLFTSIISKSMFDRDYDVYLRLGLTYKF
jgi:hypothetical protein